MSDALDNAFEVDALLARDPATGAEAGFFVGGLLPHVSVPDAPCGSMYVRRLTASSSVWFRALKDNPALEEDWEIVQADTISGQYIPFEDPNFWMMCHHGR